MNATQIATNNNNHINIRKVLILPTISNQLLEIQTKKELLKFRHSATSRSLPASAPRKEGNMGDIAKHIESNHITGIVLPCNICGKTKPTRKALRQHEIKFHKQ